MRRFSYFYLPLVAALGGLAACGGGDDDNRPKLSDIDVQLSSLNGESLEPKIHPNIHDYTLKVQSDIFGVLLKPKAESSDVALSVVASNTAGGYSTTVANTDVNQPENVPLSTVYGQSG